jgi:SHS2 domain-containing protein
LDREHELVIEFWAPTEEGVLMVGGLALVELMTGDPAPQRVGAYDADDERAVRIEARDPTERMVRWLDGVLAAARSGLLLRHATLELGDTDLAGTMYGDSGDASTLRAVVSRDAELTQHDYGWYARVTIERAN